MNWFRRNGLYRPVPHDDDGSGHPRISFPRTGHILTVIDEEAAGLLPAPGSSTDGPRWNRRDHLNAVALTSGASAVLWTEGAAKFYTLLFGWLMLTVSGIVELRDNNGTDEQVKLTVPLVANTPFYFDVRGGYASTLRTRAANIAITARPSATGALSGMLFGIEGL